MGDVKYAVKFPASWKLRIASGAFLVQVPLGAKESCLIAVRIRNFGKIHVKFLPWI